VVIPALERYQPDLIVIASGLDANAADPLARQMLYSDSYREMTERMIALADKLCGGRLAVVHEGGYSEAYVPFCGLALLEALKGVRTEVIDPELGFFVPQQPDERMLAFHFELIEEIRAGAGL